MSKKAFVKEYAQNNRYFSLDDIARETGLGMQVVKNYLQELKREGVVFSAGSGAYSSVAKEFRPDEKARVIKIREMLKKAFPFTDFIVWNTSCLQPFYHHMQAHHITFVETEKDAVQSVADTISKSYRYVSVEKKSKSYYDGIDISRDPIVVRELVHRAPRDGNNPLLEKMLVDLFIDYNKYSLMPESDYWEMWQGIYSLYRINIGKVASYSKRRKCFRELFSQLFANKRLNKVTFGAYLDKVAKVTTGNTTNGKKGS